MGWRRKLALSVLGVGGAVFFLTGEPQSGPDGHPLPWQDTRTHPVETKTVERPKTGAALVRAIDRPAPQPAQQPEPAEADPLTVQAVQPVVAEPAQEQVEPVQWVRVTGTIVNVRAGPRSSEPRLRSHPKDTRLQVLERDGAWVRIRNPDTSDTGWMFHKYLEAVETPDRRLTVRDDRGVSG